MCAVEIMIVLFEQDLRPPGWLVLIEQDPKPSTNLLLKWILYTPELQETNIKFTVKKKIGQSENDN